MESTVAKLLQPVRDVLRVREHGFRLRDQFAIRLLNDVADVRAVWIVDEVAQRMVPQLVGGAMLVQIHSTLFGCGIK